MQTNTPETRHFIVDADRLTRWVLALPYECKRVAVTIDMIDETGGEALSNHALFAEPFVDDFSGYDSENDPEPLHLSEVRFVAAAATAKGE